MTVRPDLRPPGRTRRALPVAGAALTGLLLSAAPAHAASTHSTDDFAFDTAPGELCAFSVHVAVHDEFDNTVQATADGSRLIFHTVETDTISANGKTVHGLPYHYTINGTMDADGNLVSAVATGEAWRFQLPDGGIWSAGGRNDFLTGVIRGSWSIGEDLGPVCDALA